MSMIVVRELKPQWRQLVKDDGTYEGVMLSAFVGAEGDKFTRFGIGVRNVEAGICRFWGVLLPQNLTTAWRAMWLLERVKRIGPDTLISAYKVMQRNFSRSCDGYCLQALQGQVPEIENLRAGLLEARIPDDELDKMLKTCNNQENKIDISMSELEFELKAGVISRTPEVEVALALKEKEMAWKLRAEEVSKCPLPGKQSFQRFCKDFRMRNLCDRPVGSYGVEWNHLNLNKIDRELVYRGALSGYVQELYYTKNAARSKDFGQIGHPVLMTKDGRRLAMTQVKYDQMHGMQVCFRKAPLKEDDTDEWLTLPEARALVLKLIGITCSPYANVSDAERSRGYIGAASSHKTFQYRSRS